MGLTDTIRNKVNILFDFDSQQQSNQLKNKIDTLYGKQNTTTAPNINGYSNELSESGFAVKKTESTEQETELHTVILVHIKIQTVIILFRICRRATQQQYSLIKTLLLNL